MVYLFYTVTAQNENLKADSQIPGVEELRFTTDILQHFDGVEAMAQVIDPEGYAAETAKRDEADAETAAVKAQIDGYYWSFYINSMAYEIEFWPDNTFEVRTSLVNNSGTYSVRNGYIFCTYESNGYVVEIPYELTDNDIDLDVVAAFDVKDG